MLTHCASVGGSGRQRWWGRRARRGAVLALVALCLGGLHPLAAAAAAPPNDDFDAAMPVPAVPFQDRVDTRAATAAGDDPIACWNTGSVWYRFTPTAAGVIAADTAGSDYPTALAVFTGTRGVPQLRACRDDSAGRSRVVLGVQAHVTYYFLVTACCGFGGAGGGDLVFTVEPLAPPGNDDVAAATRVSAVPFADTVDLAAAARPAGEPQPSCQQTTRTGWYAVTLDKTVSVTATTATPGALLAVYTGGTLTALTEVACRQSFAGPLTIRMTAGQVYYLQVATFEPTPPIRLDLVRAGPPNADFFVSPPDPSSLDTVAFFDFSRDPGGARITSRSWDFGDGTTGSGVQPGHRYARAGDYTARLTVTTADGRTGSTAQTVGAAGGG